MSDASIAFPLLKIGRLELEHGLRALRPGSAPSGLAVTATVEVPESVSEPQYAWDIAWADAVRQAGELGADQRTAQALAAGAGRTRAAGFGVGESGSGTQVPLEDGLIWSALHQDAIVVQLPDRAGQPAAALLRRARS